jgi:3-methylcrotonyl-CoA carboxylase alpha subunit
MSAHNQRWEWNGAPVILNRDGTPTEFRIQGPGDHSLAISGAKRQGIDLELLVDGKRVRGQVFDDGRICQVRYDGQTWSFARSVERKRGKDADTRGGVVEAPMTGTVVQVAVKKGEAVKKGAPLVVLVAMKMEHRLTAPFDGVVAELLAIPDQTVEIGQKLARIEPEAPKP